MDVAAILPAILDAANRSLSLEERGKCISGIVACTILATATGFAANSRFSNALQNIKLAGTNLAQIMQDGSFGLAMVFPGFLQAFTRGEATETTTQQTGGDYGSFGRDGDEESGEADTPPQTTTKCEVNWRELTLWGTSALGAFCLAFSNNKKLDEESNMGFYAFAVSLYSTGSIMRLWNIAERLCCTQSSAEE